MVIYVLIGIVAAALIVAIVAGRKQAKVTRAASAVETARDTQVFEASAKVMDQVVEKTAAEQLAAKARDPRLSMMTQEDLVYEVLKDCFDPEIPLNIVDLGLVLGVYTLPNATNVKVTMTSPMCPSHVQISEDIKTKLNDAGFPGPSVEVVWEPAWTPERISEAGRRILRI